MRKQVSTKPSKGIVDLTPLGCAYLLGREMELDRLYATLGRAALKHAAPLQALHTEACMDDFVAHAKADEAWTCACDMWQRQLALEALVKQIEALENEGK